MAKVMCRVSGGVTGTREALLKDGDSDRPREFDTMEEAREFAEQLNDRASRRNQYSTATFRYWAVE